MHNTKEVPVTYKEELTLRSVKALSPLERLKLIFGFNLEFVAVVRTEHRTGRTHQAVKVGLTKDEKDPEPKNRVVVV